MKTILLVVALVLCSTVVKAEVLPIDSADTQQIVLANCQVKNVQLEAIVNALLKKSGCEIKQGQIVCPDKEVKDEKATP